MYIWNTTISGNTAQGDGGGIFNAGEAELRNATISGNHAGGDGGGLSIKKRGDFALPNGSANQWTVTVTGNSADDAGGAASTRKPSVVSA